MRLAKCVFIKTAGVRYAEFIESLGAAPSSFPPYPACSFMIRHCPSRFSSVIVFMVLSVKRSDT